jgi:uncharacterized protein
MNKPKSAVSLFTVLLLSACVTINIYFPAAAAEEAADEIIKGIQDAPASSEEPQALGSDQQWYLWIDTVLNVLVSPAHAAEFDLSIDSAAIRQLRASMKKRFPALVPFYNNGSIGIQASGMLVVRNANAVPLKDRNTVNKLVAAENADRVKLYQAIASANGHPDWADDIRSTFAKRWISNAQSGWWFQASNGSWQQK